MKSREAAYRVWLCAGKPKDYRCCSNTVRGAIGTCHLQFGKLWKYQCCIHSLGIGWSCSEREGAGGTRHCCCWIWGWPYVGFCYTQMGVNAATEFGGGLTSGFCRNQIGTELLNIWIELKHRWKEEMIRLHFPSAFCSVVAWFWRLQWRIRSPSQFSDVFIFPNTNNYQHFAPFEVTIFEVHDFADFGYNFCLSQAVFSSLLTFRLDLRSVFALDSWYNGLFHLLTGAKQNTHHTANFNVLQIRSKSLRLT